MLIDILYPFAWFLLFFFFFKFSKFFKNSQLSKWDLSIAFLIKVLASLLFIYIFSNYYGEGVVAFDSIDYFNDGKILNNVFFDSPINYLKLVTGIGEDLSIVDYYLKNTSKWFYSYTYFVDDSKNVIRLASLIHFISGSSMLIHFVIMDFISLIGIYLLYKAILPFSKLSPRIIFFLLIIFPSMLFWGSALLKEPILLFSLGLFLHTIVYFKKISVFFILKVLFSILLLISIKPYVFFAILIVLFSFFLKFLFRINYLLTFIITIGIITFVMVISPKIREKTVKTISFKQHDFINIGKGGIYCRDSVNWVEYNIDSKYFNNIEIKNAKIKIKKQIFIHEISRFNREVKTIKVDSTSNLDLSLLINLVPSQSYVPIKPIKASFKQLIYNIPEALINALLRPWPTDPGKDFKYFAFIETILLFSLLIYTMFNFKKLTSKEMYLLNSLIIFLLIVSLIIGWTTPIMGAIVRYRIPVYLAILIICIICIEPPKKWKKIEDMF